MFLAIFMSFLVGSCNYELDYPVPSDAEIAAEFGISEAQHYFEQHATDLSPLNFAYEVQTRAAHLTQLEFIPEWSKAVWSGHKAVSLIEVPILSNSTYGVKERHFKNGKQVYRKYHQIERRLVVARRNTGETDMFVITIVPSSTSDGNIAESMKNFRYLGGGDFTGKVFCSTLEGEFVKAFGYTDGKMNGTLTVMKRTQLKERAGENVMEEYSSFRIEEYIPDMASPYSFNEGGFSGGIIGGGGTGGNTGVTPGGSTKCPHGNNESSCPYCLEEVVVTACPYCHVQNGCRCPKCLYCGKKERECRCTVCTRCGHKMPECTCYIYPNPDPDPDPIPGGGTGSGDSENNGTILPNVDLMNEKHFVGYDVSNDCMKGCNAIMANYGVSSGSSANVYQLLFERNGVLEYYDMENYKTIYDNAIACINRHLDANRPIIVGVNHTPNKSINEGTTDHWIVVVGREYDTTKKQYYYTYMDTGRSSASDGCNTTANRLYYDSKNYTIIDTEAGFENKYQFDVSQVRPNDGKNLGETISQPTRNVN